MTKSITGIQAAMMEARGEGRFSIEGKNIVFRAGRSEWSWSHSTAKQAETILKVLRAAPKHVGAA